jgi:acyl-CoA reductase-like NAD-dependent aldehyde dehydrogenase
MIGLEQFVKNLSSRSFPIAWPGQWAGGGWIASRRGPQAKASINPNDTREKLIEVSLDKESVQQTIDAAERARKEFAATSLATRLEIIQRFRQMLADYQAPAELTLRLEGGKPRWEAQDDVAAALRYLDWVVKNGETINSELLAPARLGPHPGASFVMLPIGVTVAYVPFSTPITSFAFYFAAAMIAGCPLIINSSAHALLSCMFLALVAEKLDLPPGIFNVVFGNFSTFRQMLTDRRVAAVLYTGSREHCDTIRAESKLSLGRQVVLQSGGKNAVIVHSSADLGRAVDCVIRGAFTSAGQRCSSTSRVFVYRSQVPEFLDRLVESVKAIKIGRTDLDGDDSGPTMGPLYSDKAVEKFLRFQTMANRESEKTLLWGRSMESMPHGNFVTPGIHHLTRFDNNSAYQGNVLFCPDVAVYDYDVLDTAIEQINTTDAAFAVSFIGDADALEERRHAFLAPNLLVNIPTVETEATLPLAGRLLSGHHRYHGPGVALYLCYPQVLCR